MFFDPIALFVLLVVLALGVIATVLGVRRGSRPGLILGVIALVFIGIPVIALFIPSRLSFLALLLLPVGFIAGLVGLIVSAVHSPPAKQAELAEARLAHEHSVRVDQIKQWEAAYAEAHDGALPPAGFAPPGVGRSSEPGPEAPV